IRSRRQPLYEITQAGKRRQAVPQCLVEIIELPPAFGTQIDGDGAWLYDLDAVSVCLEYLPGGRTILKSEPADQRRYVVRIEDIEKAEWGRLERCLNASAC